MHNILKKRMFQTILHTWNARDEGVLSKVYSTKICISLIKKEKMEYKMGLETLSDIFSSLGIIQLLLYKE